jgi:hypothetical protein
VVAEDGTFWVIDAAKQRVAHFSRTGQLIGEIPDSVGSGSADLAFVGPTLWVMCVQHKGLVFPILADGRRSAPSVITDQDGRIVYVEDFIPTPHGLFTEVIGYPDLGKGGPNGIFEVRLPDPGTIEEASGFPLKDRTAFHAERIRDDEFDQYYEKDGRSTVQPMKIDVVSSEQFGDQRLKGFTSMGDFVVDGNDVYAFVQMSVTKPGTDGDQIGARFLLRVGRSPWLFERLPDGVNFDETQGRHIALGPDGHIYLMYMEENAVSIYRR